MSHIDTEDAQIANTIFQQLGGRGFSCMIGMITPILVQSDHEKAEVTALFRWKAKSREGIQAMTVTLVQALDTYRVTFGRPSAKGFIPLLGPFDDVYCEDLQPLFERSTGLTTIPPIVLLAPESPVGD